jgi:hypothetical protein
MRLKNTQEVLRLLFWTFTKWKALQGYEKFVESKLGNEAFEKYFKHEKDASRPV